MTHQSQLVETLKSSEDATNHSKIDTLKFITKLPQIVRRDMETFNLSQLDKKTLHLPGKLGGTTKVWGRKSTREKQPSNQSAKRALRKKIGGFLIGGDLRLH